MVRSNWIKTLIVALASSGLTWSQQPAAPPVAPASPGERIMTVQEMDKPAQKCRVIKSWRMADGAMAHQVQALDSGEQMTIVESGPVGGSPGTPPGSRIRAVSTRIFHWGRHTSPPPGTPVPPEMGSGPVIVQEKPVQQKPVAANSPPAAPDGRPYAAMAEQPRAWPPAHADGPPTKVASQPAVTPVNPVAVAPKIESPARIAPSPRQSGPIHTVGSPYAPARVVQESCPPVPVVKAPAEPCVTCPPPKRGSLFQTTKVVPVEREQVIMQTPVVSTKPEPQPTIVPAQPSDWKQSWGKTDSPKPPTTAKMDLAPLPPLDKKPSAPVRTELPQADSKKPDPLKDPDAYSRPAADNKLNTKSLPPINPPPPSFTLNDPGNKPAAPVKDATTDSQNAATKPPLPALSSSPLPNGENRTPLGAQSVLAAGDPKYIPVPIVTMPDVKRPPEPPKAQVPKAPQPNQALMNAFTPTPPVMPPMSESGQSNKMANAFTPEVPGDLNMMTAPGPMVQAMPPRQPYPPMPPAKTMPPASAAGTQVAMAGSPAALPPKAPSSNQPLIAMLKDAEYPSHREWAADKLALLDWRTNSQIVEALLSAARDDPAAMVRAGCVRSLAKMNVNTPAVVTALREMKSDRDAAVQHEVEQALSTLAAGSSSSQTIQPTKAIAPGGSK